MLSHAKVWFTGVLTINQFTRLEIRLLEVLKQRAGNLTLNKWYTRLPEEQKRAGKASIPGLSDRNDIYMYTICFLTGFSGFHVPISGNAPIKVDPEGGGSAGKGWEFDHKLNFLVKIPRVENQIHRN